MPTITLTNGDDTTILTGTSADGLVDTIYGLDGNDSILGDEGLRNPNGSINLNAVEDDLIYGGAGDDTLAGSFGANTVIGGLGSDTLDNRTVTAEIGLDTIYGDLVGDTVTGDADSIFGKQGNDIIYGGGGNDNISSNLAILTGGGAVAGDTVYGGAGDDTITTLNSTGTNSSSVGDLVYGGTGNDSILGAIENPAPGLDEDNLFGGAGNDIIDGNGGNDSIDAGAGNDTVLAADDADTTDGGTGIDLIDFTNDSGAVVFNMTTGATTVSGPTGTDIESNVNYENVIGTAQADNIQGNDENNSIFGAGGADQLTGGGGSDTFVSGGGDDNITGGETQGTAGVPDVDVVDYSDETLGIVVNYTGDEAGTAQGVSTGLDTFAEIERIIFTDQNDAADASANSITGVTLDTGAGDDFVEAGQAADSLDGGDGTGDTLSYAASVDGVTLDLGAGTGTGGNADGDTFVNFEFVQASNNNDSIIGSSGADTVNALEGNDTILGGVDDVIDGGGTGPAPDPNDFDTLAVDLGPTGVSFVVNADPGNPEQGTIDIFDGPNGTGNIVGTITFQEIENIVCFTRGTMIETPDGEVAIEDLAEVDLVMTRDNGAQPLRWIGSKALPAHGKLAPVMIKAGALDNDRDLQVSQLHRMLVTDWRAELMFGEAEVLATAKHLVNGDTIYVAEGGEVEYFHMLFDNHEIVTANGAASESFHPGEQGMSWLEEEMREEIFTIFPELRVQLDGYGPAARMSLKAYETRALKR
ncbi:MAG: Hint domain-containing protein [Pseudomonadota bacterium]